MTTVTLPRLRLEVIIQFGNYNLSTTEAAIVDGKT
jgi:hypothetical protein